MLHTRKNLNCQSVEAEERACLMSVQSSAVACSVLNRDVMPNLPEVLQELLSCASMLNCRPMNSCLLPYTDISAAARCKNKLQQT